MQVGWSLAATVLKLRHHLIFRGLACLLLFCAFATAQSQQTSEGAEEDPTRVVFLSARNDYFNLKDGAWSNRLVLRKDVVLLQGRRFAPRGLLTRADFSFGATHDGAATHAGLGDLYGQVLFVPHSSGRFALAAGSGLIFPTATHRTLGSGKWQAAPMVAPVWYLPPGKGFSFVKIQDVISFAGSGGRADIHHLLVTPALLFRPSRRWWVLGDLETKINWENQNRADFRAGLQVGRVVGGKLGFTVKPEIPFGGTRQGDWKLQLSVIRYQ